jgi:splicing factor U2AF subunit
MFPTLTSFVNDLNNPFITRTINSGTSLGNPNSAYPSIYSAPSSTTLPTSSKLLVNNLPLDFNEQDVAKFLKNFGKIKTLEMIKDPKTGKHIGQCQVEYETETATSNALHYVMGVSLKGNVLYIKRSTGVSTALTSYPPPAGNPSLGLLTSNMSIYGRSAGSLPYGSSSISHDNQEDFSKSKENAISKVICIKDMVSMKELNDDDDYDDLYDDVMEECKNYGKVLSVKIPRPDHDSGVIVSGIGKVFVEYATRDGAAFAREHLKGKSWGGRFVDVVYHPEDMYKKNHLD